jgi:tyrosyl-tRNA synthetase
LHKLGHKIIVLVGDYTAMIGDPSDKTSARAQMTRKDVQHNLGSFKEQIAKILNFKDTENPIELKFNSEWLSKLRFEEIIKLATNFTVQQILERDMFEKRMAENKPLYVHEFFYPLMQGYDSVVLNIDLEIGGTDQTFNMLAGRILSRRYLNKEKFVLTTTLLTNPVTGEKMMSKSLGTGIGLNETPENIFGKIMALPDECMIQMFIDCTRLSKDKIKKKINRLKSGENPKDIKLELAHEITKMYHGQNVANATQISWENTFSNKGLPNFMQKIKAKSGSLLTDIFLDQKLVKSKTQARRLIKDGAVKDIDIGTKITDPQTAFTSPMRLKVGKKNFIQIVVSD